MAAEKQQKISSQKWEEDDGIDTSSDKLRILETRWLGHVLERGNLKRVSESFFFLTAAQNNAITTDFIKANIDNTLRNRKWRLCEDWDKTDNPILVQK